ncbi:type III pantothenate kinase [Mycoplasma seminis]|uniref:Type III pantothenate kinase n=1 Tax=Mycoplasma seminis TaxID=512749 RepID=A0ABY9HAX5_9MOLU|nr:type III pantothenate kinase [Mycoplasma seminis]WLP85483.1 type III pantothenate kinase [Mycoplasma seminis]
MKNKIKVSYLIRDLGNTMLKLLLLDNNHNVIAFEKFLINKTKKQDILDFLKYYQIDADTKVITGSTNPDLRLITQSNEILNDLNIKNNYIVNAKSKVSFNLNEKIDKNTVGVDILAACQYAYNHKLASSWIFMFGSASVAILYHNDTLQGVSIAPGIMQSFEYLGSKIAKLKSNDLIADAALGQDTIQALNSGLFNLMNGFILSHLLSQNPYVGNVITTGGTADLIKDKYDVNQLMILYGYLYIYLNNI